MTEVSLGTFRKTIEKSRDGRPLRARSLMRPWAEGADIRPGGVDGVCRGVSDRPKGGVSKGGVNHGTLGGVNS